MIDQWIQQLNASDPELRREAVLALGRSKDPAALRYLAAIFRTDPEPELRELARKAGVYIQQQQNSPAERTAPPPPAPPSASDSALRRRSVIREIGVDSESVAAPQARAPERGVPVILPVDEPDDLPEDDPAPEKINPGPVRGRADHVTKANPASARKLVDSAMTLSMNGDNAKALKSLTQALRTDPNLINDNYFNSMAATVTGKDGDAAIQVIVDGDQRSAAIKEANQEKRQRRTEKHMETVKTSTGRSVGFEMLIYLLTVIIGPVLVQLVFIQSALRFLEQFVGVTGDATTEAEIAAALREGAELLSLGGVTAYLITALISAAIGLIGFLIQAGVIHYAARLLGGHGTFNHLLATLLAFYNKWLPIFFVFLCLVTGLFFVVFPSPVLICFTLPLFGLIFYITFKTFGKIGEAYDIGLPMGCVAYLIASIVLSLIGGLISALIGSAMVNVFTTLLQTPA